MMGHFYQLRDDMTVAGRWHIGEVRTKNGFEPLLDTGTPFHGSEALFAEVTRGGRVLDFSLTSFAIPVATRGLAEEVHAIAGADLQCVPIDIANQSGMIVMNSVRVIRCLDETRSEFIKWTRQDHRADLAGQYRQVTKLFVDPRAIPSDAHFFRIESWLVALIVSEKVKMAMERVGCVGAKFIEVTPHAG
jgi:hypothetical protein